MRRLRILIVDDSDFVRSTAAEFLRDEGHVVTEARDGQRALDLFDREGAELILLDIQMPGMSGLDVADALVGRDPQLPIFAFTAMPQVIGDKRPLFQDVFVKPVSLVRLSAELDAFIERSENRSA